MLVTRKTPVISRSRYRTAPFKRQRLPLVATKAASSTVIRVNSPPLLEKLKAAWATAKESFGFTDHADSIFLPIIERIAGNRFRGQQSGHVIDQKNFLRTQSTVLHVLYEAFVFSHFLNQTGLDIPEGYRLVSRDEFIVPQGVRKPHFLLARPPKRRGSAFRTQAAVYLVRDMKKNRTNCGTDG